MDRSLITAGLILAGFLKAGTFQEPNGLYTLTYPTNWEVRVIQQEVQPIYALQRTPAYDATILLQPFGGTERGADFLSRVDSDLQQAFPQVRFTGDWTTQDRGTILRAYRDFEEQAQGKSSRGRVYVIKGPYFGVVLLGVCEASSFSSIQPEMDAIARSVQLAQPDPRGVSRLAGTTWVAASGYSDVLNEFSSSAEWRYTFDASGRFTFHGATMASDPGMVAGDYGNQGGTFFVIGRKVFLVYDDGSSEVLTFIEHDVLEDETGRRFIPEP